jgi:phospholipid/cholesterol/gamma-HCH transport system permease protein
VCGLPELIPYMFGYLLAAKVGCGLVAEIGAMRANEELDAMEVMGTDPMSYVVATRIAAVWLCVPLIYLCGAALSVIGGYLVAVVQLHSVSPGGWAAPFWDFQAPVGVLYSLIKALLIATAVVFVATFYGYRASGGAVGIGAATAKSMVVNLILIHVIGAATSSLFFGARTTFPIGG